MLIMLSKDRLLTKDAICCLCKIVHEQHNESLNFSPSYYLSMETIPIYISDIILPTLPSNRRKWFTPQHSLCHYSSISLPLELVWHDICWGSMDAISPYNPSVILSSHGNRDSSAPHVYLSTLFLVWWSISDPQAILQSDTRCDGEDSKPSCAN